VNFDELMDGANENRVVELSGLIQQARNDYYNGTPKVSDEVFDAWVDELKSLDASSPAVTAIGAPVPASEWKKAAHGVTMGSLDKVNTPEELTQWAKDFPVEPLFVTEKLDGVSIHVRYTKGVFTQAITRGDGIIGEDITQNVARMKGVPPQLKEAFTGSLRGEIVLLKSDHATHFPTYANPRNAASGISKRYDGEGSEHLTVMFYQVVDGRDERTEVDQFNWIQAQGLTPPKWYLSGDPASIWKEYQEKLRADLDYDIDGLVVRVNDLTRQLSLGEKDGRPKGATAFKFTAIQRKTRISKINWQVGASGRITPVAEFAPVNVMGATVTNASVYNIEYIRKLGICVGAEVMIARANDVIPRVISVTRPWGPPAAPPTHCPVCGHSTAMEGEYLVCLNTSGCSAQAVGRIERYIAGLDIKEWGDVLVEKLVTSGKVTAVPHLYGLSAASLVEVDRISDHMAEKLLKCLWEKNPVPLEMLLGALSIPLCQTSTIQMVMATGADTWGKMFSLTSAELQATPGLGPVKAHTLWTWMHTVGESIMHDLLVKGVEIKQVVRGSLTGKTFCFTGSMERKRGDLEDMVISNGGVVKGSVGKGLNYLVIADPNSTSSKAVAARKNGTLCISESDFLKMVVTS
jgi:DNA ligase (NAD+)